MLSHFILFTESDLEYLFLIANDEKRSKDALYPPTVLEANTEDENQLVFNKITMQFLGKRASNTVLTA